MKAAVLNQYGTAAPVSVQEVAVPELADTEVLVKVKAAGVNPVDNLIKNGNIWPVAPYSLPLIMGNELAGEVEAVGSSVTAYLPGDRVMTRLPLEKIGAFAQYVAVDARWLCKTPNYLSDVEAAAVPLTALTAMEAFTLLELKQGQSLFISGGSGGFGAMAIPLAKAFGYPVYTSGSAENRDRVMALGADLYFDYKTEDYSEFLHDVDGVISSVGVKELPKEFSILKPGGHLVALQGMPNRRFAKRNQLTAVQTALFSMTGLKYDRMAAKHGVTYDFMFCGAADKDLKLAVQILEEKGIKPNIAEVLPLDEVNEALEMEAGHGKKGRIVLTMD